MSLSGWQSIAALFIAAGLAITGALVPAGGGALIGLAGSIVTGVFALMQPRRDPMSRGRAADRIPTAAGGVPLPAYDPHQTPREGTQPLPPGHPRRRP